MIKIRTTGGGKREEFEVQDTLTENVNAIPTSKAVADYVEANASGGGDGFVYARKSTSTTRTSTTATEDSDFTIAVVSGGVYEVELIALCNDEVDSMSISLCVSAPIATTVLMSGGVNLTTDAIGALNASLINYGLPNGAILAKTVITTTASGDVKVYWGSGDGASITVLAGSLLKIKKLN